MRHVPLHILLRNVFIQFRIKFCNGILNRICYHPSSASGGELRVHCREDLVAAEMGAGGDAYPYGQHQLVRRIRSSDKLLKFGGVKDDLIVLKSIWLNKASGQDHASRLESFYGPQAHACKIDGSLCSLRFVTIKGLGQHVISYCRRQVQKQLSLGSEASSGSLRCSP